MSSPTSPDRGSVPTWLVSAGASWFAFVFVQITLLPGFRKEADRLGQQPTDLQQTCFQFSGWWSEWWWVFVLPALGLLVGFGAVYAYALPDRRRALARMWLAVFVASPLVLAAACALVCM